jgi:hypothetical protein
MQHAPATATLERFTTTFFGYGSWAAPIWIVGMEEGGGATVEEVMHRLAVWEQRGQRDLEDLAQYHHAIGVTKHLNADARIQPTWAKLIHLLLGARGLPFDTEQVRSFQARHLGRNNGDTCILELLPLPSPNVRTWLYAPWNVPYLRDRDSYRLHLIPQSVERIRARVSTCRPKAVVFLGMSYLKHWQKIAGTPLEVQGDVAVAGGDTLYIAVRHPAARGVTNAYFRGVGELIARQLGG